jgi:hypothetical protein
MGVAVGGRAGGGAATVRTGGVDGAKAWGGVDAGGGALTGLSVGFTIGLAFFGKRKANIQPSSFVLGRSGFFIVYTPVLIPFTVNYAFYISWSLYRARKHNLSLRALHKYSIELESML